LESNAVTEKDLHQVPRPKRSPDIAGKTFDIKARKKACMIYMRMSEEHGIKLIARNGEKIERHARARFSTLKYSTIDEDVLAP